MIGKLPTAKTAYTATIFFLNLWIFVCFIFFPHKLQEFVHLFLGELFPRKFSKEKTVLTPLAHFHSRSFKKPSPYGVVLIMSPWNYPFLLTIDPLVDAIAAGNTAVVKPSAYSPNTSLYPTIIPPIHLRYPFVLIEAHFNDRTRTT